MLSIGAPQRKHRTEHSAYAFAACLTVEASM